MENQNCLDWVKPQGGVVFFPRIKPEIELDTAEFYRVLNDKYGTFVGPGHWFDIDDRYFRVGYAWPKKEELRQGLIGLCKAVEDVRKN
jgi:aspartate/methionine/tyrosine aminotransferase